MDKIIHADVLNGLSQIEDGSVHLIVTSPPYNVGIKYGNHNDSMNHWDYLKWMKKVWWECKRVLCRGGRICINIDATMNMQKGGAPERVHPLHANFYCQLRDMGYIYRGEIVWTKQNAPGKDTAWGCYDEETYVLTKNGMKKFVDVTYDDYLATMNPKTKEVEYQKPSFLIKQRYVGVLKHIKSKSFDLLVTPDHNMLFWNNYKKQLEIRSLSSAPKNLMIPKKTKGMAGAPCISKFMLPAVSSKLKDRTSKIVRSKLSQCVSIDMDIWLSFLGIFLTDGSVYYNEDNRQYKVSVYQSKTSTINDVSKIIERMPFQFKYKENKHEFYVCDKRLASYLSSFGNKDNRTLPAFIHDLSVRQQRIFLDALFLGDGHIAKHGKDYLAVSSSEFVSNLCSILVNCGYHFSVSKKMQVSRVYKGKEFRSNHPINIVRIHRGQFSHIRKLPEDRQYDGYVYCAEVPNHTLFVGRNGKYTWCGNSYCLCSNPHIRRNSEYIVLASKDDLTLEGDHMMCDLTKAEFHEWTLSEWKMAPETRKSSHPVPFPRELVKRCVKLFSYVGNVVLDPFNGSGTTTSTAYELGRKYIGIDNCEEYCKIARNELKRIKQEFSISGPYKFTPSPVHQKQSKKPKRKGYNELECDDESR